MTTLTMTAGLASKKKKKMQTCEEISFSKKGSFKMALISPENILRGTMSH